MSGSTLIILLLVFSILLLCEQRNSQRVASAIRRKRNKKETKIMVEVAKKFIGKQCIIDSFDGKNAYTGFIQEVTNGALYILNNGKPEIINLDYVIRIREYPKKKNGKNKTVAL